MTEDLAQGITAVRLRDALEILIEQVYRCAPVDGLGHKFAMNKSVVDAQMALSLTPSKAEDQVKALLQLRGTGYEGDCYEHSDNCCHSWCDKCEKALLAKDKHLEALGACEEAGL